MFNLDIDKVCRVCLEADSCLLPLFVANTVDGLDGVSFADMISQCTNYVVCPDDGYPELICNKCVERTREAYSFKMLYEDSHRTLTALLTSVNKFPEEDSKPNVSFSECSGKENYSTIQPYVELVKTENETIVKTEAESEAEDAGISFEANSEAEEATKRFGCVVKNELIIKEEKEPEVDAETDESNLSCEIGNGEPSNGEQSFLKAPTIYEEEAASSGTASQFKCNFCNISYDKNELLKRHISVTHKDETLNYNEPNPCNPMAEGQSAPMIHDPTVDTTQTLNTETNKVEKPNKCEKCNKTFCRRRDLNLHILRAHTTDRPYKCEDCDKAFICASYLKVHKRSHTGEKPYKCTDCNKEFARAERLTRHRLSHTGEKLYKCGECDKTFTYLDSLKVHKRSHTGGRAYKCPDCNKSFNRSDRLETHRRSHTGERPYKCEECDKAFACIAYLEIHLRSHTGEKPFKCDICSSAYTRIEGLKKHQKLHTDDKIFNCEECNRTFASLDQFKWHKRFHVGEKTFQCTLCPKNYTRHINLKSHIKNHHQ